LLGFLSTLVVLRQLRNPFRVSQILIKIQVLRHLRDGLDGDIVEPVFYPWEDVSEAVAVLGLSQDFVIIRRVHGTLVLVETLVTLIFPFIH